MTLSSKRRLAFIGFAVLMAASVCVVVISARRQAKTKPKEWLTSVPQVGSKVKNLEIRNARIVRQDTDVPAVEFQVWNNSNRAVMAIEVSCGEGSIAKDGLEDEENPVVIITPHGSLSAEMSTELSPDTPIVITAAVFDDKKEEGEKSSLDLMKRVRLRQRALLKAKH